MIFMEKTVEIEWEDSRAGPVGWEYRNELLPLLPVKCRTIGFLLEETDEYITIAQTVSEAQVFGRTTIPKCAILKPKLEVNDHG